MPILSVVWPNQDSIDDLLLNDAMFDPNPYHSEETPHGYQTIYENPTKCFRQEHISGIKNVIVSQTCAVIMLPSINPSNACIRWCYLTVVTRFHFLKVEMVIKTYNIWSNHGKGFIAFQPSMNTYMIFTSDKKSDTSASLASNNIIVIYACGM